MQGNETAGQQEGGPGVNTACRMTAGFETERRASPRRPVIRSAKLVFGEANVIYDCLVLDESAGGVMIDLGAMVKVPEEVTIRFNSGGAFPAQRRWAAGTKAGFKFTGGQIVSQETALRMKKAADILEIQGLGPAVQMLRTVRFLDNDELRRAAEDAESAMGRLQAVLTRRVS
jgi:hypothetical protein